MSQVWLCLLLLVTLSLQIPEVNLKLQEHAMTLWSKGESLDDNSRKDAQKKPTSNGDPETILLDDAVNKSSCQPRETLVKVYDEFSEQEQYHFRPDCVSVKRCSGCCSNEETKCVPEHTSTVEFEVLRYYVKEPPKRIRLQFVAHTKCHCRFKETN